MLSTKQLLVSVIIYISGFLSAYLFIKTSCENVPHLQSSLPRNPPNEVQLEYKVEPDVKVSFHGADEDFDKGDYKIARELSKNVKVLCWIMTNPDNHQTKAKHIKATWGRRCNILLFMSTKEDPRLPTIALPVNEGRDNLWAKTKEAFKYVYEKYKDQADWFLKADDDTYVIMENLRFLLSSHSPLEPLYFGCRFKPHVKQGFMSGGAGYVLSRESLDRFINKAIPNETICRRDSGGSEDVEIGKCLEGVGVGIAETRDTRNRSRFFPYPPERYVVPGTPFESYYREYWYYEEKSGLDCCSDRAISFHYIKPEMMYVMEYFIYRLRPYGINYYADFDKPEQQFIRNGTISTHNP